MKLNELLPIPQYSRYSFHVNKDDPSKIDNNTTIECGLFPAGITTL
jgi:hypothetical protein